MRDISIILKGQNFVLSEYLDGKFRRFNTLTITVLVSRSNICLVSLEATAAVRGLYFQYGRNMIHWTEMDSILQR